jgi:hypothetical protein
LSRALPGIQLKFYSTIFLDGLVLKSDFHALQGSVDIHSDYVFDMVSNVNPPKDLPSVFKKFKINFNSLVDISLRDFVFEHATHVTVQAGLMQHDSLAWMIDMDVVKKVFPNVTNIKVCNAMALIHSQNIPDTVRVFTIEFLGAVIKSKCVPVDMLKSCDKRRLWLNTLV